MALAIEKARNLGPVSARWLHEIGVETLDDLTEMGAVAAYRHLKARSQMVSLNLLYAMQGAILDIHWHHLPRELKISLKEAVETEV